MICDIIITSQPALALVRFQVEIQTSSQGRAAPWGPAFSLSSFSSEAGLALAPPSPSTTRLFFSVPTFSSYVMLSRGRATAETCPTLSPARAPLPNK